MSLTPETTIMPPLSVLLDLYVNATLSLSWQRSDGWDTLLYADVCVGLYGVSCDGSGNVSSISLPDNGIAGVIPATIGSLTSLTVLSLARNYLRGAVPSSLASLRSLVVLDLSGNLLVGSVPVGLGSLTQLTALHLERNSLSGRLPATLSNLTALQTLTLSSNWFNDFLPSGIGRLTALALLSLNDNQFLGAIPSSFSSLTSLTRLYAKNSGLCAFLPPGVASYVDSTPTDINNPLNVTFESCSAASSAAATLAQGVSTLRGGLQNIGSFTSFGWNLNNLLNFILSALRFAVNTWLL